MRRNAALFIRVREQDIGHSIRFNIFWPTTNPISLSPSDTVPADLACGAEQGEDPDAYVVLPSSPVIAQIAPSPLFLPSSIHILPGEPVPFLATSRLERSAGC
jgi:hypothetical protein